MEDTLGVLEQKENNSSSSVLILVLMEDTLGVREQLSEAAYKKS